jgi:hypothetical protein
MVLNVIFTSQILKDYSESGEDIIVVDSRNQDVYVKDNEIVLKGTGFNNSYR